MMKSFSRAKTQRHKAGRKDQSSSLRLSLRLCVFAGNCLFILMVCMSVWSHADTRGRAELKKGDYDNAFKLLSARLASNPNDFAAQQALLRVYIETGRYTEAETAAKKFLTKTPETATVRHELAEVLAITGRHTEAITEFERAAADSEKSDGATADKLASDLRRAELLELIGQEDRAKTIYESSH